MTHSRAKMRLGAVAAALIFASLSLVACSPGASGDDPAAATTITLSAWYEDDVFGSTIAAANEILAEDGIQLDYTQIPLDQYNTWLSTQLASGEGPDLIMDGASFPARVSAGYLLDITDDPTVSDFTKEGLALASDAEGRVYGIPSYGWFSGVFYNEDLFEQAGLDIPTTFEELLGVADAFSAAGVKPMTTGLADSDKGLHLLMGYLENAFYHNGEGSPEVDTQFAFGETTLQGNWDQSVEQWSKVIEHGLLTEQDLGMPLSQATGEFTSGQAAMFISGPWDYQMIKDAGLNFGMFPHVGSDPDNQWLLGGPAASIGVNVDSANSDAALTALHALASQEAMQAVVDANPGAFSYREGVEGSFPDEYDGVADVLAAGQVAVAWDRWGVNMPAETMLDTTKKGIQALVGGQITTDEFIAQLDAQADALRF